jgi:hypothetical protein
MQRPFVVLPLLLSLAACQASQRAPALAPSVANQSSVRVERVEPPKAIRADLDGPSPDHGDLATPEPGMVSGVHPIVVTRAGLRMFATQGGRGQEMVSAAIDARARAAFSEATFASHLSVRVETTKQRIRFGPIHRSCHREVDPRPCDPDPREGRPEEIPEGKPVTTSVTRAASLNMEYVVVPTYRFTCQGDRALVEVVPMADTGLRNIGPAEADGIRVESKKEDESASGYTLVTVQTTYLEGTTPYAPRFAELPTFNASRDAWVFRTTLLAMRYAYGQCK